MYIIHHPCIFLVIISLFTSPIFRWKDKEVGPTWNQDPLLLSLPVSPKRKITDQNPLPNGHRATKFFWAAVTKVQTLRLQKRPHVLCWTMGKRFQHHAVSNLEVITILIKKKYGKCRGAWVTVYPWLFINKTIANLCHFRSLGQLLPGSTRKEASSA